MARRYLAAIAGLALALHGVGIAQTLLPAQDGLKFFRVARAFHSGPWIDAIRGSDQHPLYAACIALAEPPVAFLFGDGPTAWRVAAQLVSALAATAALFVLFGFARALFGERPALLATLIYVLLPIPAGIGRDTLGDSLALLLFIASLRLGEVALRTNRRSAWIGTGVAAGVGYLARPELLVVPVAVAMTAALPNVGSALQTVFVLGRSSDTARQTDPMKTKSRWSNLAALGLSTLAIVGCYAVVKGEVSEKLAIRASAAIGPSARPRATVAAMPAGLDDPRWDFSPKEEDGKVDPDAVRLRGSAAKTAWRLALHWGEGLAGFAVPIVLIGIVHARSIQGSRVGRQLVAIYVVVFSALAIRHATSLGYLSGRHALTLVLATVPWVGAGTWAWVRGFPVRYRLDAIATRRVSILGLAILIGFGVTFQVRGMHATRWGHWAAGQWLRANAAPGEAVLDTRGWAAFVRDGRSYDYWHVRQALSDGSLAYIVVGEDELTARSRRAETLRALVAYACEPAAAFPERQGKHNVAVRVYRFHRPESWEGMHL